MGSLFDSSGTDYQEAKPQEEYLVRSWYKNYAGVDEPDPEGLKFWMDRLKVDPEQTVFAGFAHDVDANKAKEEASNFEIPTDLYPKSYSQAGLPEWGNEWVKNYLDQYSPQITSGLAASLKAMDNPVSLNDAERANLNQLADENLTPIINNLGAKGVLNSSVSKDAIAKVLSDLETASYDRAITNNQNKISNYQKAMALLESILGASRQSTSDQSNAWAPYSDMLGYILGGKE